MLRNCLSPSAMPSRRPLTPTHGLFRGLGLGLGFGFCHIHDNRHAIQERLQSPGPEKVLTLVLPLASFLPMTLTETLTVTLVLTPCRRPLSPLLSSVLSSNTACGPHSTTPSDRLTIQVLILTVTVTLTLTWLYKLQGDLVWSFSSFIRDSRLDRLA